MMNKTLSTCLSAVTVCLLLTAAHIQLNAQQEQKANGYDLKLLDWKPRSELVVRQTEIKYPRFPVIDIHNHLGKLENMKHYLDEMDAAGVWISISLDGRSKNDFYKEHLKVSQTTAANRLLVFFAPDWERIDEPNFGANEAKRLHEAYRAGVRGVKIFKSLGLTVKDKTGKVVPVDDPRIDPIWAKCGELRIPVMIHVSDPKAFFKPIDEFNERYDELADNPDWGFSGDKFPAKEEILNQRNRVLAKHPKTIFIGAHMGNLPEELGRVSLWLDQYPNFYVDIDARISELGRQPFTARKFMIKYQDRVLFGTDKSPDATSYRVYYRFLETEDEYFDPGVANGIQGRWMIYGLNLPDEVLEKIYNKNAMKLLNLTAK